MKIAKIRALICCVLLSTGALAHTDDVLDAQAAPHGGQMRMAGIYHFELVVTKDSRETKENPVVVYLTDHAGNKVSSAGASGTATLLAGKIKSTATLKPDGDNRLKGYAKYASTPDMKIVVSVSIPGQATEQARFTPLTLLADPHAGHDKH